MRAISWIAMLAVLASVLAPVAARAMAAWSGPASPWDEICTAFGIKQADAPSVGAGTDAPGAPGGTGAQSDCDFCLPSANPAALPARPAGVSPAVEHENTRLLFFFISAPRPDVVPDDARPRAPPQSA